MLTSGPEAVETGKPWRATLEVVEFGHAQRPTLVARQGARNVIARQRRVWFDPQGAARYRTRLTFPAAGRWRIEVMSGKRRFVFPALAVGSGNAPVDSIAFPEGMPPEVVSVATNGEREDAGPPAWILPLAGAALAGVAVVSRRRR